MYNDFSVRKEITYSLVYSIFRPYIWILEWLKIRIAEFGPFFSLGVDLVTVAEATTIVTRSFVVCARFFEWPC